MRLFIFLMSLPFFSATAMAQSGPPSKSAQQEVREAALQDDVPMDVYLDALTHISPAAREGADAYLQAFQQRCGRPLRSIELRRMIAIGAGDPVLMGMMRAAAQHDNATLQRLVNTVACAKGR